MAAISYVLLPITGLVALALGNTPRTRFHGLQAIVFGTVWAAALYAASALSPGVTKVVFAAGAAGWVFLIGSTALGRDPKLPGVAGVLHRAAADDLRT